MQRKMIFILMLSLATMLFWGCEKSLDPYQPEDVEATQAGTMSLGKFALPNGAELTKAEFWIYGGSNGMEVNVHRITEDWDEATVTWGTVPAYDANVFGSYIPDSWNWHSAEVTGLVKGWLEGTYLNYGLLLDQFESITTYSNYHSSEGSNIPYLKLFYTYEDMSIGDDTTPAIADAYIWELSPGYTGNGSTLYTGYVSGKEKQSLLRFDLDIIPPPTNPGTGTPGYWMNHLGAWPVEADPIIIGGVSYTKEEEAYPIMKKPVKKDKTYSMFPALVAARLNVMIGNDDSCVAEAIAICDAWMTTNHLGSAVSADSEAWQFIEEHYIMLDEYNNGMLCAPSRDEFDD